MSVKFAAVDCLTRPAQNVPDTFLDELHVGCLEPPEMSAVEGRLSGSVSNYSCCGDQEINVGHPDTPDSRPREQLDLIHSGKPGISTSPPQI